ncbi:MAG: hypothetical protein M4579_000116 [Chaenotheca gracillima]|nr:MAG: hypothetical protein M4579_000116 [Chaenotheca gracillima]
MASKSKARSSNQGSTLASSTVQDHQHPGTPISSDLGSHQQEKAARPRAQGTAQFSSSSTEATARSPPKATNSTPHEPPLRPPPFTQQPPNFHRHAADPRTQTKQLPKAYNSAARRYVPRCRSS